MMILMIQLRTKVDNMDLNLDLRKMILHAENGKELKLWKSGLIPLIHLLNRNGLEAIYEITSIQQVYSTISFKSSIFIMDYKVYGYPLLYSKIDDG